MPKVNRIADPEAGYVVFSSDGFIASVLAASAEFKAAFKRSHRGNLWRRYEGRTLTVFKREGDGRYAWSIADENGPRFSRESFETEEDALGNLAFAVGIG